MHSLEKLRSGALAGVRRLDLSCGLTEFPSEIFGLADSLEVLNLTGNALSSLPDDLSRLHRLRVIFCSGNRFEHLPAVLGSCGQLEMVGFKANRIRHVPTEALPPRLRWLILTDNAIETLPATLGERPRLEKLMLAGNRLAGLPDLSGCEQLALLRIAANHLDTWPAGLLSMPRLAWLATAGNRAFHNVIHTTHSFSTRRIPWADLQIHSAIGEGASGVIHKADWTRSGSISTGGGPAGSTAATVPVAVKLFKGAMTSDGLPECEMAACLAASGHPGLVGVEGLVHHHPDGTPGLVLPLLDAAFRPLAGPPSFVSCSRDVYAPDLRLPVDRVAGIARSVASAVAHLHARGLTHGDLYGHNILWNGADRALLSDFGAASFLPDDPGLSTALQRLEARAYGCLLEELIEVAVDPGDARLAVLAGLRDECLQPQVSARPLFSAIERRLAGST